MRRSRSRRPCCSSAARRRRRNRRSRARRIRSRRTNAAGRRRPASAISRRRLPFPLRKCRGPFSAPPDPWRRACTQIAALMSPGLAGSGVSRSPCRQMTACMSAPARASSSTLPPPKQKPTAAWRLRSPILRLSLSLRSASSAAPMRRRRSGASARSALASGRGFRRAGGDLAAAIHVGDEGHIFAAGHRRRALDGVVGDAEPVRRHQQQRPASAGALVIDQRAVAGGIARLIIRSARPPPFPPVFVQARMISPISPASYCVK